MKNKGIGLVVIVAGLLAVSSALAATEWSTQEYDLYPGDFDGDGKTDLLYVAKDASQASGIARSDDGGGPNIAFQSWPSNYLGIPWHSNLYNVLVADFDGNGKADVFLQRKTPGDHYLLQADANGKITGISQTIANGALTLTWSADQHKLHAGDFDGNGKADLFLQATSPSITNAVVLSDANGLFTVAATQSWTDASWSAFKWSTRHSNVFVGDFNGDNKKDLLLQAKPNIVLIDYDVPIPVPTYQPNTFGVVKSQGGTTPFAQSGVQQWSRNANGVDWSPNAADIVVGNFDGTDGDDVLLQARSTGRPSYLLAGYASGATFTSSAALATNVTWSADSYRLIAGNFDGGSGVGVYYQAQTTSGTNYYANVVTGSSVSQTAHNPNAVSGTLPVTAVGRTSGMPSVSAAGTGTYSIPLQLPPGSNGLAPEVGIAYDHTSGDSLLGVGFSIAGLSTISRCNKTIAQDGVAGSPNLSASDAFCLDGNKLRPDPAAPGTYRTEIETFAKVVPYGSMAGTGPQYWEVHHKNGLIYQYGNTTDSLVKTVGSTAARTWALNRVRDRSTNYIDYVYTQDLVNGSYRPAEIRYTGNATKALGPATKVVFVYEPANRPDPLYGFRYGTTYIEGSIHEFKRLDRLDVVDIVSGQVARTLNVSYDVGGGAGNRSRISAIQECVGSSCLSPTLFHWINGIPKLAANETSTGQAVPSSALVMDVNGDGRDDLVYSTSVTSGSGSWRFMLGTASGYTAEVATGLTNWNHADAQAIDWNADGLGDVLAPCQNGTSWCVLQSSGSNLTGPIDTTVPLGGVADLTLAIDVDGDARDDLVRIVTGSLPHRLGVRLSTGSSFASTETIAWTAPDNLTRLTHTFGNELAARNSTSHRRKDFNGDGRDDFTLRVEERSGEPGVPSTVSYWAFYSMTSTIFTSGPYTTAGQGGIAGDFNGDGLTDLVYLNSSGCVVRFGRGTGLAPQVPGPACSGLPLVLDYDGDGLSDIVKGGTTWSYSRSTGNGFAAFVDTGLTSGSGPVRVADINGDGLFDIGRSAASNIWSFRLHQGPYPDLLDRVTDGFGVFADFDYAPLTADNGCYARDSAAPSLPLRAYRQADYVVCSLTASDGVGGSYTTSFNYFNALFDTSGRGYLGFERKRTVDSRDNILHEETFRQEFPYTGSLKKYTQKQPGSSTTIVEVNNTLQLHLYESGTALRSLPYVAQTVQQRYEVGGAYNGRLLQTNTTNQTVDSVTGTVTDTISTVVEGSDANGANPNKQHTSRTYHSSLFNDFANWCFGRPAATQQINSHTLPNGGQITRTSNTTWNGVSCRPDQSLVEPGDVKWQVTTGYHYDDFGNVDSMTVTPAAGQGQDPRLTTISWGADGRAPRTITNPLGQLTKLQWDFDTATANCPAAALPLGQLHCVTDPNQQTSRSDVDVFGRLVREQRPDGTATTIEQSACNIVNGYCGAPDLRSSIKIVARDVADSIIRTDSQFFDALDRVRYQYSQMLSGANSAVATTYDTLGRVSTQSVPYGAGEPVTNATFQYDLINRLTRIDRPTSEADASLHRTTFSHEGLATVVTDALNRSTTQRISAVGQIVEMFDAAGSRTQYEYDAFGNLRTTRDVAGNEIVLTYNVRGMKMTSADPDMGGWTYDYYPLGEIKTQTDAKGAIINFEYDKLSRPLVRREPGPQQTTWQWDTAVNGVGRLNQVSYSANGYQENYFYDNRGRVRQTDVTADGSTYSIEQSYSSTTGLLETLTYPASTGTNPFKVRYGYQNGILQSVRDFTGGALGTTFWQVISTNARGQAMDELRGNTQRTISMYDRITGLLSSRTSGPNGGAAQQNLEYGWNKVGMLERRKSINEALTETFYYDALNRLDYSQLNGTTNLDINYDALGNISNKSDVGSYVYHAVKKHAVTSAGANTYTYDANGNMATRNGSTITWSSLNLPTRINHTSGSYSEFSYGSNLARYKQTAVSGSGTETTIYVGGLLERVTRGSLTEYRHQILADGRTVAIHTRRSDGTNDTVYPLQDHLGSIDTLTDAAGAQIAKFSYGAFGNRRNAATWSGSASSGTVTRRGFTEHEHLDDVGLVHMNGRVYDPTSARFVSADPFVQAPYFSQSLNRYSYVFNSPLNYADPSGFEADDYKPNRHNYGYPFPRDGMVIALDGSRQRLGRGPEYQVGRGGANDTQQPRRDGGSGREVGTGGGRHPLPPRIPQPNWNVVPGDVPASGADFVSTVGGLGQGFLNAVPGAYYAGQSQLAWQQGSYWYGAALYGAALADAFVGVATFGQGSLASGAIRSGSRLVGAGGNWATIAERQGGAIAQTTATSCGAACGEMLSGISQAELIKRAGAPTSVEGLASALGVGWRGGYVGPGQLQQLIGLGRPFAAQLRQAGARLDHLVVIDGVDAGQLLIRDPWGGGSTYRMTMDEFLNVWTGNAVFR